MGLNIKNREVEILVSEVARMTGESKTEAIRRALIERKRKLAMHGEAASRREGILRLLEEEIWPQIPPRLLGRRISRKEREKILGYGPNGV